jgi:hypothetical protein
MRAEGPFNGAEDGRMSEGIFLVEDNEWCRVYKEYDVRQPSCLRCKSIGSIQIREPFSLQDLPAEAA